MESPVLRTSSKTWGRTTSSGSVLSLGSEFSVNQGGRAGRPRRESEWLVTLRLFASTFCGPCLPRSRVHDEGLRRQRAARPMPVWMDELRLPLFLRKPKEFRGPRDLRTWFSFSPAGTRCRVSRCLEPGEKTLRLAVQDEVECRLSRDRTHGSCTDLAEYGMSRQDVPVVSVQKDLVCSVCYDEPVQMICLPCRHTIACKECLTRNLRCRPKHRGGADCMLCRRRVTAVLRVDSDGIGKGLVAYEIDMGF